MTRMATISIVVLFPHPFLREAKDRLPKEIIFEITADGCLNSNCFAPGCSEELDPGVFIKKRALTNQASAAETS